LVTTLAERVLLLAVLLAGGDRPVQRADDAGGHGAGQPERVADRHHRVAHLERVGVTGPDRGEVGGGVVELDDGQVR
jgi:hypothetical protein